jgi:hypothetical protein
MRRKTNRRYAGLMQLGVVLLCLGGALCAFAQTDVSTPRVIVIGVDGLSIDGITKASTPRLHELMGRAAWTLAARGVIPTLSSPNWVSIIGGAPPELHGITSNGHLHRKVAFEPVCRDGDGKFPTIFGILRQQQPRSRIAIFHDWGGFADLVEKRAPDIMRHEAGASRTVRAAIEYWTRYRPNLMFIHLDNVDHAGHAEGWLDESYYKAVAVADSYVGEVLDMVTREGGWDSTYVLVVSDHGGTRSGHGKNSLAELQVPWILAGPDIAPGRIDISVNTYDTAATLAWIFLLDPPQCWTGQPLLAAFQSTKMQLAALPRQR